MTPKNNSLYILGGIVLIGLLMWFLGRQPSPEDTPVINESQSINDRNTDFDLGRNKGGDVLLACDNNKAIGVNYFENGVILNLSDQRTEKLGIDTRSGQDEQGNPEAYSSNDAGGNTDEYKDTIRFWIDENNIGYVQEKDIITYSNCIEPTPEF